MASTVLADVSAALSLVFRESLKTQVNSVVVLPYLLPVLPGSGKSLDWTAEFTGATDAVASAEGAALDSSDADAEAEVPANLPWAQYTKVSSVTDLAQAAAGSNFNPQSIGAVGADLLLGRVWKQVRRMARGIAADLYGGNPGASPIEIAGAALAIDSTGTFATIDPSTYTEWVAHEGTSTLASISFDQLSQFFTSIYANSGLMPEFCTCGVTVWNAIKALYTNYEAHVVREVQTSRGGGSNGELPRVIKLLSGMRAIEHDQIPIVLDPFATAGTLYAWNTQYVTIRELEFDAVRSVLAQGPAGVQAVFRRLANNPELILPRQAVEGMMARSPGITPFVKVLGTRGMSEEAVVGWFGQTEWGRRNSLGKHIYT